MKIGRLISRFDRSTEELLEETNIDDISLEILKAIFKAAEEDPLMYNPYTITNEEADKLKDLIDIQFDLNRFFYQVDCFQL
jgi:hypothetical protein